MTKCPSDSTECLLRAILEANSNKSSVNWNALNAGLTAAVGLLALLVALTTVFQGFLGAGPGRLKASKQAIGPWSFRTTNWFSWNEFRVRSTAQVPFLSNGSCDAVAKREYGVSLRQVSEYPATWVNLLGALNLHPEQASEKNNLWTQPCQTDYVPSDIQAAPAFATIEVIVNLAAFAGCKTIEMVNDFPRCSGPASQLEIRTHPQLGTVAAYDQFPQYLRGLHYLAASSLQGEKTVSLSYALGYARGQMRLGGAIWNTSSPHLNSISSRHDCTCAHKFCLSRKRSIQSYSDPIRCTAMTLLTGDPPCDVPAFPFTKQAVFDAVVLIVSLVEGQMQHAEEILNMIRPLTDARGGKLTDMGDQGYNYRYNWGYVIDPSKNLLLPSPMYFSGPKPHQTLDYDWSWLAEYGKQKKGQSPKKNRPGWMLDAPPKPEDLFISTRTLEKVILWIKGRQGTSYHWTMETSRLAIGAELSFQLQEIDYYLLTNWGNEAYCEVRRFAYKGSSILPSEAFEQEMTDVEKALQCVLAFRAVMVAILLDMAPDNSVVCGTELGSRVVRCI